MSHRLLILVTDLEIGGTPTVVRELAIRLHGRRHCVAVACLGRRGPVADEIADAGIEVTALGALGPWDLRIVPRLIALLRTGNIPGGTGFQPVAPVLRHGIASDAADDQGIRAGSLCHRSSAGPFGTVLSFLIHANALAAVACSITGTRLFQSIQTTQPWPRWHWALQRLIAPLATRIIVPSQSVAEAARQWSGIAPQQFTIIPNGVDPAQFQFSQRPMPKPCRVGFLGRLDRVKRIADLIDAAGILRDEIHLDIFGDGPERPHLERRIGELGVQEHVTLHRAVARPQDALKHISLLVLPSEAEGFGLVLIEAMAAGIPVIATDAPGIRDVVIHNQTGLLVPIADPPAIALAIRKLLNDQPLCHRLTAAARQDIESRFSWPTILPAYEALLFSNIQQPITTV